MVFLAMKRLFSVKLCDFLVQVPWKKHKRDGQVRICGWEYYAEILAAILSILLTGP